MTIRSSAYCRYVSSLRRSWRFAFERSLQAMSTEEDLMLERWVMVLNSLPLDDICGPEGALSAGLHCYGYEHGMLAGERRMLASIAVGAYVYADPKVLRTQRCRTELAGAVAEEDHWTTEEEHGVYT